MSETETTSQLSETDRFYLLYGKAMAAWAHIEHGLALWFSHCTGLGFKTAENLFFSSRAGFSSRSRLLLSALQTTKLDDVAREFISEARERADSYCGARNRLAHGVMHPNRSGDQLNWHIKELSQWEGKEGLDDQKILLITTNFEALSALLKHSFVIEARGEELTEFLRPVYTLPNKADSTLLSKKQLERLAQLPG
ncbi:hypothetical protein [Bradyrhizobium uaiense]|uniref:Uncharacterized protein n=1 Tax=Bradyrhizobium uaiense TaxID=2594946 RepID=A0A6P1B9G6_9BRAD|nr:hypothetical protein [Bradyrhizobium uaiense]NEU95025.1 hypothetical protein [Bradyrhizobium uaiense]